MLGQIWVQRRGAFNSAAVVLDHLFQSPEPSIMHVRAGQLDVSKRRHRELASIPILFRGCVSARVCEFQIEPVVREVLALEKRAAMAMETIRPILFVARIIFSMKKL